MSCEQCDNPAREGCKLCEYHLMEQRLKMADYRAKRKTKGLCSRCPNTARVMRDGNPSTLCDDCRTHVRDLEARQRQAAVSL